MRENFVFILLFAVALVVAGCVAAEHKGVAGAGIGAASGAALGAAFGSIAGSPGLGAAIGAGGGALIGKTVGDEMQRKEERREMEELQRRVDELEATKKAAPESVPGVTTGAVQEKRFVPGHWEYIRKKRWVDAPTTQKVWVPERMEGGKLIPGHYEDKTIPGGYWEEYEEKIWVDDRYE